MLCPQKRMLLGGRLGNRSLVNLLLGGISSRCTLPSHDIVGVCEEVQVNERLLQDTPNLVPLENRSFDLAGRIDVVFANADYVYVQLVVIHLVVPQLSLQVPGSIFHKFLNLALDWTFVILEVVVYVGEYVHWVHNLSV